MAVQKTSLETLGNRPESKLKNHCEDRLNLKEEQQPVFQKSILNPQAAFNKIIADQCAANKSHINSLPEESSVNFDQIKTALAESQTKNIKSFALIMSK